MTIARAWVRLEKVQLKRLKEFRRFVPGTPISEFPESRFCPTLLRPLCSSGQGLKCQLKAVTLNHRANETASINLGALAHTFRRLRQFRPQGKDAQQHCEADSCDETLPFKVSATQSSDYRLTRLQCATESTEVTAIPTASPPSRWQLRR